MTDPDRLNAEVEVTRAELAQTVAALRAHLRPAGIAARGAGHLEDRVSASYQRVRALAPPSARPALDLLERAAAATRDVTRRNPGRSAAVVGATLLAFLALRRARRR